MIKAILLGILKVLGGVVVLGLLTIGLFFYKASRKGGYRKGLTGVKYYYKENGHEQWTWDSKKVKGVDRSTFEDIPLSSYGKDKNRVYYKWQAVENSDPITFSTQFLEEHLLSRDHQNVYYGPDLISRDANHFQRIDKQHFKDNFHVYILEHKPKPNLKNEKHFVILNGADPKSFRLVPDLSLIGLDAPTCLLQRSASSKCSFKKSCKSRYLLDGRI